MSAINPYNCEAMEAECIPHDGFEVCVYPTSQSLREAKASDGSFMADHLLAAYREVFAGGEWQEGCKRQIGAVGGVDEFAYLSTSYEQLSAAEMAKRLNMPADTPFAEIEEFFYKEDPSFVPFHDPVPTKARLLGYGENAPAVLANRRDPSGSERVIGFMLASFDDAARIFCDMQTHFINRNALSEVLWREIGGKKIYNVTEIGVLKSYSQGFSPLYEMSTQLFGNMTGSESDEFVFWTKMDGTMFALAAGFGYVPLFTEQDNIVFRGSVQATREKLSLAREGGFGLAKLILEGVRNITDPALSRAVWKVLKKRKR